MNAKQKIIMITLFVLLPMPCLAAALEIRQTNYCFAMDMTKEIIWPTFVIGKKLRKEMPIKKCRFPVIHFALNSAELTGSAKEILSTLLQRCHKSLSVTVTGHTCALGPDSFNQVLSLQRAKVIAAFLKEYGIDVAKVQGKGSQHPIKPENPACNRRVEITVQ